MGTSMTKREYIGSFSEMLTRKREVLASALPKTVDVDRFIDVAQTAVLRDIDEMAKCTQESLYLAVKRCAQAGLMPDGEESAIVRYGDQAAWMPMVKGIIRLMLRSPNVAKVEARVVREGDEFTFHYGLHPTLDHRPISPPSGEPFAPEISASYGIVYWSGLPPEHATFEVVERAEIERARKTSRASESPAWRHWYGEMARKVALHRISKYVDLSPEAQRAIQADIAAGWEGAEGPGLAPGFSLEEKLAAQVEEGTNDLRARLERARTPIDVADEPENDEDLSEGEREPTAEEEARAEEGRRRNLVGMLEGYPSEMKVDAAEMLFGGSEDVAKTDAGFVAIGDLDSDRLARLLDECRDRATEGEAEDE